MSASFEAARRMSAAMGIAFDEPAVRLVATMEGQLERLRLERHGQFAVVLNALEHHVEEGHGDPEVVRHLGDALLRLTALHPVPEATVRDLTQTLGLLHSHVVDCAQAARR